MSHDHAIKKTHVSLIEVDDVLPSKLARDKKYFGESNSNGRKLEFDFEFCLSCGYRLLNGQPIITQGLLDQEFERFVTYANNNSYVNSEETLVQHSDFETLQRLIDSCVKLGELRENKK